MYYPTLKEARALAQSGPYGQVPVTRELLSDFITPIQALRILRSTGQPLLSAGVRRRQPGLGPILLPGFRAQPGGHL